MKMFFAMVLLVLSFSTNIFAQNVVELSTSDTVIMRSIFDARSVSAVIKQLSDKDIALASGKPLYLFIDSPGGDVEAGMLLIAAAKGLSRPVITITNFGASMAFITAQLLGDRYVMPYSVMMSHRVSGGIDGQQPGELDSRYRFWNHYQDSVMSDVGKRIGISVQQLYIRHRNEWWTLGKDAVNTKLADKVVFIKCNKDMDKSIEEVIPTFFGNIKATWSSCPLVITPLSVDMSGISFDTMSSIERRNFDKSTMLFFYNKKAFFTNFIMKGKGDGIFLK